MRFERDDAKIGLLVFFGVAIFIGLLFHRSLTAVVKKETLLRVSLDNASDIAEGTEVQLQGLRVGQVNQIELKQEGVRYSFLAILGIRTDIVLWKGTKAVVSSKGLGSSYLDLELPPVGVRTQVLDANAILPSESGASIGTLVNETQGFIENLNEALNELRQHLKEKGLGALLDHPQVHQTLVDLDGTFKEFKKVATDSDAVVKQGGPAMASLERSLVSMEKATASLQGVLEKRSGDVSDILVNLSSVLKQIDGLSAEVRQLLKGSGPEVEASLKALHQNLLSTQELLEILKAKPNRIVWGTPSKTEKESARKRVEDSEKQAEPPTANEKAAKPETPKAVPAP
jgi:phospholipid/cholesterol/gamma-HCH transport system substrate-binding protein